MAPLTRPSLVTLRPACHTQVNTSLQLRWFVLSDDAAEGVGGTLRYYEGRNGVTRVLKGEIRISPADVSMVRTYTHEANGQEKCLGVRLTTPARVWELVGYKSDAEVRQWAELLSARIRHRVHRPTISQIADSTAAQQARGAHASPSTHVRGVLTALLTLAGGDDRIQGGGSAAAVDKALRRRLPLPCGDQLADERRRPWRLGFHLRSSG